MQSVFCYLSENVEINPLRDFRYVANATRYSCRSICLLRKRGIYLISKLTENLWSKSGGYIEFEHRENAKSTTMQGFLFLKRGSICKEWIHLIYFFRTLWYNAIGRYVKSRTGRNAGRSFRLSRQERGKRGTMNMEFMDAHAHIYERLTGFGARGEARAIGGGMVEWATGEKERLLKAEHGEYGFSYDMLASLMEEGASVMPFFCKAPTMGFRTATQRKR